MRRSRGGFLSPVVRRLLAEHGLEASEIEGTGGGGRVTRADVEAAIEARSTDAAPTAPSITRGGAAALDHRAPAAAPAMDDGLDDLVIDAPVDAPEDVEEPVEALDAPEPADGEPELVAAADAVDAEPVEPVEPVEPAEAPNAVESTDVVEPPPPGIRVSSPRDTEPEPASPVEPAPSAPVPPVPAATADERQTVVPHTGIRRLIATNLRASVSTAAHAFCAVEADFERVARSRSAHGEAWREREGHSLTYLPFVARAVCLALEEFPNLNSSFTEDELIVRHDVHLGIAVDLDHEGLIVPVVRDAGNRSLAEIARSIVDLAERARAGRLSPDEVMGGTFTITNPGPSGTLLSVPIINQPQVGILATDTVRRRPVMIPTGDGGEGIAVHAVGMLGLSFDHRAVDGAYAASFVSRVGTLLATHDWDAELAATD